MPALAPFVVELMSSAFAQLPDPILLPWLPTLITTLRGHGPELVPLLIREAGRTFPGTLPALDAWVPPWAAPSTAPASALPVAAAGPVLGLLSEHPEAVDAVAQLLGCSTGWRLDAVPAGTDLTALLTNHPETAAAVADLLAR